MLKKNGLRVDAGGSQLQFGSARRRLSASLPRRLAMAAEAVIPTNRLLLLVQQTACSAALSGRHADIHNLKPQISF
jgi:hypothetical protein